MKLNIFQCCSILLGLYVPAVFAANVTPTNLLTPGFNMTQGFESDLGSWTLSNTYWRINDGRTPSSNTGPDAAAVGSKYLYLETSSGSAYNALNRGYLESPAFEASSSTELIFRYHMYGSDMGGLYVNILRQDGIWQSIWGRNGQQHTSYTDDWVEARVPLTVSGETKIQIVGVAAGGYRGDMAIDSISIMGETPPETEHVSLPYSESFESGTGSWVNKATKVWSRDANGTPSGGTGPSTGADGNYYMYMETSNGHAFTDGDTASFLSPTFDAADASIKFSYHMYGSDMGTLSLDIYSNGQWDTLWSKNGQQNSSNSAAWNEEEVSFSGYSGSVQLRFKGIAAGNYRGDMAIDQLQIGESAITYQYDALGRLIFVRDPSSDNREYCYDAAGNRTELSLDTDSPSC